MRKERDKIIHSSSVFGVIRSVEKRLYERIGIFMGSPTFIFRIHLIPNRRS